MPWVALCPVQRTATLWSLVLRAACSLLRRALQMSTERTRQLQAQVLGSGFLQPEPHWREMGSMGEQDPEFSLASPRECTLQQQQWLCHPCSWCCMNPTHSHMTCAETEGQPLPLRSTAPLASLAQASLIAERGTGALNGNVPSPSLKWAKGI